MNKWVHTAPERRHGCPRLGCSRATSLPMLLLLGGLLVMAWPACGQQQLVINPISNTNLNVTLNPRLSFTVSVSNTVSPNSLFWSLGSGAPNGASITNDTTHPNAAVFTWTPTGAQVPSTNFIT